MLTNAQKVVLNADIASDPLLLDIPNTSDGNFELSLIYNDLAQPVFMVWRTNVSADDIKGVIVWSEYLSTTVAEKMTFELMNSNNVLDASQTNIRNGLADIFSGSPITIINLLTIAKRSASRIEKLFATGSGTINSPGVLDFEGSISRQDISDVRSS